MPNLNIESLPLKGYHLLQASAGTGKTHNLVNLYLRLLLESAYTVNQILVVTFTEAATQELRSRIQHSLYQLLFNPTATEDWLQHRLAQAGIRGQRLLRQALQHFDEAQITTIHGFCQQVLQTWAFESGAAFDRELLQNQQELVQMAVEDFWRQHFYQAPEELMVYALSKQSQCSMARFKQLAQRYLAMPGIQLLPQTPPIVSDLAALWSAWQHRFYQIRVRWKSEGIASVALFSKDNLKRYQESHWQGRIRNVSPYFEQAVPALALPDKLHYFNLDELQTNWKASAPIPGQACWQEISHFMALHAQLMQGWQQQELVWQWQLCQTIRAKLQQFKQQQNVLSFDDMLLNLQAALLSEQGPELADTLRQHYPVALIDEFQDTDGIQAQIFTTIYPPPHSHLMVIGDPKQSIYRFRGADIAQYLAVANQIPPEHHHQMTQNWRSSPALIQAVNTLFSRRENPFVLAAHLPPIEFHPVEPATSKMSEQTLPALQLQVLENKESVATWVAAEITRWLHQHPHRSAQDIAVLVRKKVQGEAIEVALKDVGVPCVWYRDQSIWLAPVAADLEKVLQAIEEPVERLILVALATPLMGWNAEALFELQQNEARWESLLLQFRDYHEQWGSHGFRACWQAIVEEQRLEFYLAASPEGLAQLAALRQLCQLLLIEEPQHQGLAQMLAWYQAQRRLAPIEPEANRAQMVQDTAAIKIVTIHRSKGLEYPVVFCPYLWQVNPPKTQWVEYYDSDRESWCLDLEKQPAHVQRMQAEEQAEELRLAYVALTRAKEFCYVVWTPNWKKWNPLHHLLNLTQPEQLPGGWADLEAQSGCSISVSLRADLNPIPWQPFPVSAPVPPPPLPQLRHPWNTASFTALMIGQGHPAAGLVVPAASDTLHMGDFPRGSQAGEFLHHLLESISFKGDSQQLTDAVRHACQRWHYDEQWVPVLTEMLCHTLTVPLNPAAPDFVLQAVPFKDRVVEMDFQFPFGDVSYREIDAFLTVQSPYPVPSCRRLAAEGLMRGAIDLVVTYKQRYYILDYKSNYLGYTPADYHVEALNTVMVDSGYILQYLIYSVALHRYLRYRVSGYSYESHFGGVYYLFLRGLQASARTGIFYERPSANLVEGLSALWGREHF